MAFASYSTSDLGSPAGDVVKRLPTLMHVSRIPWTCGLEGLVILTKVCHGNWDSAHRTGIQPILKTGSQQSGFHNCDLSVGEKMDHRQAASVPAHESRTRHEDTSSAWKRCILALDLDGEESVALDLGDLNRLGARRDRQAASCQSRGRRQQVMPEPQPSSFGSIRLGMPLRSTNRMPVRHAR
jgi:hypothetical protein